MKKDQLSFFGAIEYPILPGFSMVLQLMNNTGSAVDFHEFSEPTYELTLGFQSKILNDTVLEFGLIENLFKFDNSPDFDFETYWPQIKHYEEEEQ